MAYPKKILVFPAGSEIGLEIERSFRNIRNFIIYGATSAPDHSEYTYENMVERLPMFDEQAFPAALKGVIEKYNIDYIFPAHDELVSLLPSLAEQGVIPTSAEIIGSSLRTANIARYKSTTYEALGEVVLTPKILDVDHLLPTDFPVFAKPDRGQGSRGAKRIMSEKDLQHITPADIVCEYLPGEEFTVDCFTDRHGVLRYASARQRSRVSNGISVASKLATDEQFHLIATQINSALEFRGMWFYQVKRNACGELTLLEIAPRVAGGMGYSRAQGVNLPLLAVYDRMNHDVQIFSNDLKFTRDSALSASYKVEFEFDHVYVDLDDTLIFGSKTNSDLVGLLYHWKNQGKSIKLITRHRETYGRAPEFALADHLLHERLFDNIIEVGRHELKSDYIRFKRSIFIDDSTSERKDVSERASIPTFTCFQACEMFRRGKGNF